MENRNIASHEDLTVAIKGIICETNNRFLPTNRIMSDIKQPLESVIVILQIATKVGVCSCLEQITDKMRIKFPSNLWRLMKKTILREKCYTRKHF